MTDQPDLSDILNFFSPTAQWVSSADGVPEQWVGYSQTIQANRLTAANAEIALIGEKFPKTSSTLRDRAIDVFLIWAPDSLFGSGLFRVFNISLEDNETSSWVSLPPVRSGDQYAIFSLLPSELQNVYERVFNGFTSMFGSGGLLPLHAIKSVYDNDLDESVWVDDLAPSSIRKEVFEIASNGAGVHALLDIARNATGTGIPTLVWADDDDGIEDLNAPMWDFIDSLMEISMSN